MEIMYVYVHTHDDMYTHMHIHMITSHYFISEGVEAFILGDHRLRSEK